MKTKFTYPLLLLIFLGLTAFVLVRYKKGLKTETVAFYPLKERTGPSASLPEWASVRENSDKLIRTVREKPEDLKSALALASLYLQEARITGDYTYYHEAALRYIDEVLSKDSKNFNAMVLKAVIQLSQHHFPEALQTAETAVKVNPYNAFVYGVLVDGHVEMGNYTKAVEAADKMMSIRPDIRSYARVAYLREIHGELQGAIDAMKMAAEAGGYGDEGTAWCRVQLAKLYESKGQMKHAEMHYTIAQNERPGYPYALAGLARIAATQKEFDKAVDLCQKAMSAAKDASLKEQLAEIYLMKGDKAKADAVLNEVVTQLTAKEEGESGINHHAGKELAYVYLMQNEPQKAVDCALKEYSRRPDNIDVNEALGWAYFQKGDTKNALRHMQTALRTNCKNPSLLCRAGLVYAKSGDAAKAKTLLQEGLRQNPLLEYGLKEGAESVLKTL